jgi:hypothetical protein
MKIYSCYLFVYILTTFSVGLKTDKILGGWRDLHNEDLHNLYSSPNIIRMIKSRKIRWAGHVTRMADKKNGCRIFVGKPEGNIPLRRPRHRWEDNIEMGLR